MATTTVLLTILSKEKLSPLTQKTLTSLTPTHTTHTHTRYTIPFFGTLSLKIAKKLSQFDIHVTFSTPTCLHTTLSHNKDPIPKPLSCGVYSISCGSCNAKYIGQTGRSFKQRIKEHRQALTQKTTHSHFANHLLEQGHSFNADTDVKILEIENRYTHRLKLEAIHINN